MGLGSEASLALVHVHVISINLCGPGALGHQGGLPGGSGLIRSLSV